MMARNANVDWHLSVRVPRDFISMVQHKSGILRKPRFAIFAVLGVFA
jgi:hypothetical protein